MTTPQTDVVNFYLADLTLALRVLPVDVRREIHSGIAEELRGLDADAAHQRIEELGDPMYIAAAALDEVGVPRPVASQVLDKPWYTRTTILVLLFGGLVIPFLGWIVGAVMLWSSKTWTTLDKIVGTLLVPFGLAGSFFIAFTARSSFPLGEEFSAPMNDSVITLALALVVPLATAFYLAIRSIRRNKKI